MEIDDWLATIQTRMDEVQRRSAKLTEDIAAASVRMTSPDGVVTVELGAGGALQDIELGPRAAGLSPTQLTVAIKQTVRKAQQEAAGRVVEALDEFGAEGQLMQQYIAYQPPADPADPAPAPAPAPPQVPPAPQAAPPVPSGPPAPPAAPAAPATASRRAPARDEDDEDNDGGVLEPW
jgi:DNA-binding protein YbaB